MKASFIKEKQKKVVITVAFFNFLMQEIFLNEAK